MCSELALAQRGLIEDQGARSLGLAGISSTLDGSDALFNNFANVTATDRFGVMASTQRRFNLEELTVVGIGAHIKAGNFGHLGLRLSQYGFDEFSQQQVSIHYARQLNAYIALAVNFDFLSVRINEFGSTQSVGFGIGLSGKINDQLRYGIQILNPEKLELTEGTELNSLIRAGIVFAFSEKLNLYTEFEKNINEDPNLIVGLEYLLSDKFYARIGANSSPGGFALGLQYRHNSRFIIDGGAGYDTILGTTPGISLQYRGIGQKIDE